MATPNPFGSPAGRTEKLIGGPPVGPSRSVSLGRELLEE